MTRGQPNRIQMLVLLILAAACALAAITVVIGLIGLCWLGGGAVLAVLHDSAGRR